MERRKTTKPSYTHTERFHWWEWLSDVGHNPPIIQPSHFTKDEVFIKDFFSKCDQVRSFLRFWSDLLEKSLLENFIFWAVSSVNVVTDTDAQSCLWGLQNFLRADFKNKELIPMKHTLFAANKEQISVSAVMEYVSSPTNRFYFSWDVLIQLSVVNPNFPHLGGAILQQPAINNQKEGIAWVSRMYKFPPRPKSLPIDSTPNNNEKMCKWLLEHFQTSVFNNCLHQQPLGMTVSEISLHASKDAVPHPVRTAAPVPPQWQESAKTQLDNGVSMGVREKIPIGKSSPWCHWMVITPKSDGSPQRKLDLSPLNA